MELKEIKAKWCEALRNGTYIQTTRKMRYKVYDHYEYCAVGVLYEVMGCEWGDIVDLFGNQAPASFYTEYGSTLLKIPVRAVVYLNDTEDKTFVQIADWLEENWRLE